jgi:hypothetical protein
MNRHDYASDRIGQRHRRTRLNTISGQCEPEDVVSTVPLLHASAVAGTFLLAATSDDILCVGVWPSSRTCIGIAGEFDALRS